MSAIAAFSVDDGQATPVSHTFNPIQTVPPLWKENGDATVPVIGQNVVTVRLKDAAGSSGINRLTIAMAVPVLETPTGGSSAGYTAPPQVAYTLRGKVEFLLPNRSTAEQRKDLRRMFTNSLGVTNIFQAIDNLERPY
jgi:hypothetical protein